MYLLNFADIWSESTGILFAQNCLPYPSMLLMLAKIFLQDFSTVDSKKKPYEFTCTFTVLRSIK